MKIAGIVGGIAPESTIEYYRRIVALYRARTNDGSYPPLVINSIDLQKMIGMVAANQREELIAYLSAEVQRVADAGAQFAFFASNTPHIVFDRLRERSPIPMISIVEATRDEAKRLGRKRLGLIGTRFTMQATFYRDTFAAVGMQIVVPRDDEQIWIHDKYMNELVNANFLDETRNRLLAIIDRMRRDDHVDSVILGGTELPLILSEDSSAGIPLLDTTKIHTQAAVDEMLWSAAALPPL